MNECQVGGRYNAGSYALSNLAKVSPGARYAWSYWYGKSNLQPINNVVFAQIHTYVDRNGNVAIDFRTGAYTPSGFNGDHGPGLRSYTQVYPPVSNIGAYTSWSYSAAKSQAQRTIVATSGAIGPGNDWTGNVTYDDNPWGGAVDVYVNVYLTCTP
jgi:hypothetical protein